MQYWFRSVVGRLVLISSAIVFIILLMFGWLSVRQVTEQTHRQVNANLEAMISTESLKIVGFFKELSALPLAVFSNPQFQRFFTDYQTRRADLSANQDYQEITAHFGRLMAEVPAIKSMFFASQATGEYFFEQGRQDRDADYYAYNRPWYKTATELGYNRVTPPDIDIFDNSVIATVHYLLRKPDQSLLGIGGIDVRLSTIGKDVLGKIRYQGEGQAFLITDSGSLIFFPGIDEKELATGIALAQLDQRDAGKQQGFTQLQQLMLKQAKGNSTVQWQGEEYQVVFHDVALDNPKMRWSLGFLVPHDIVDAPIRQTTLAAWGLVLLLAMTVALAVALTARRLLAPLQDIVGAMTDIARGEGDLTQRLRIKRDDELGQLAGEFNHFVEQIQQLVQQCNVTAGQVSQVAGHIRQLAGHSHQRASQQFAEVELVATAVTEMSQTIEGISQSAATAQQHSLQADASARQGNATVQASTEQIGALSAGIDDANTVMTRLRSDADQITKVLDVIAGIAAQTNLLALNAAIEAARAGEQGRGFAVVADEVRTLAGRTQASTADIQKLISGLQQSVSEAEQAMQQSSIEVQRSVAGTGAVQEALSTINDAMLSIRQQTEEIAEATRQQVLVAADINQQIVQINDVAHVTAESSAQVRQQSDELSAQVNALQNVLARFKV
jgi:methyl-accepting chemotaxis protein